MEFAAHPATLVIWGGFALAFVFGIVASQANFCTMGAVSDIVNMGHWGRMRMWLLAIAVAIVGAQWLAEAGGIDLGRSIYQRPTLNWLSLLVGGTLFGVGMSLAGGCANKNLIRVGGGSVRSLVVLAFLAISAYMTLKGLFGQWRATWLDPVAIDLSRFGWKDQHLASLLGSAAGLAPRAARIAVPALIAIALLLFVLKDRRFRANPRQWIAGVVIGVIVVVGWFVSGRLGFGENPDTLELGYFATNTRTIESLSFVAPLAYGLELLMLWTDRSLHLSFGIATAVGVVLGSAAWSLATRRFRWEGFASLADLRNQLVGAVLMGFGGVTAMGCTVGQGLAGVSTLAVGSFIALAGIVGGAVATLKLISWRAAREA